MYNGVKNMKNIVKSAIELVGNTPLMQIDRYKAAAGLGDVFKSCGKRQRQSGSFYD